MTVLWATKILRGTKLWVQIFISIALLEIQSNSMDSNGVAPDLQLMDDLHWVLWGNLETSAEKQLQQTWIVNTIGYQPSGYQIMGAWVFKWTLLCPYSEAGAGYFINVEYLPFPHESSVELRTSWSVIMLRYIFCFQSISELGKQWGKCSMSIHLNPGSGTLLSLSKWGLRSVLGCHSSALGVNKLFGEQK